MNELKLNETPIRTSRNFLINNIKLTDVEIPETVEKFKNIEIIGETKDVRLYGVKFYTTGDGRGIYDELKSKNLLN